MRLPTFARERALIAQGFTAIGVDEVGVGCLAGPVVAAAMVLPLNSRIGLVRDSKLLSAAQRERVVVQLAACGARWAIGSASVEEIDRWNIRQATYLAMRRAVEAVIAAWTNAPGARSPFVLVDAWTIPNLSIPQCGIVRGDRTCKTIAAASIVAKVARDRHMLELDAQYPEYHFARHKGYGTEEHRKRIKMYGRSSLHRATFCILGIDKKT